jgi:hypothetical protein
MGTDTAHLFPTRLNLGVMRGLQRQRMLLKKHSLSLLLKEELLRIQSRRSIQLVNVTIINGKPCKNERATSADADAHLMPSKATSCDELPCRP